MSDGNFDETGDAGGAGAVDPLTGKPVEAAPVAGDPAPIDDGSADPDWYQNVNADPGENDSPALRDWLKASGIKDIDGLAKIARDNQKALRESGRIKVPGEGASEAEIAEYRKGIGVPDDAKGYAVPDIKDADGNPVELNNDMLDRLASVAHKNGLPKAGYDALVADFIDAQRADIDVQMSTLQADTDKVLDGWGRNAAENIAAGHRAIKALDLSVEEVQGLKATWGAERALETLIKLGRGLSEDSLITGGQTRFGVSGAEAQATLNAKRGDQAWVQKASTPGTPEYAEHERLTDAIAADAVRRQKAA